jgi:hypothetical protein
MEPKIIFNYAGTDWELMPGFYGLVWISEKYEVSFDTDNLNWNLTTRCKNRYTLDRSYGHLSGAISLGIKDLEETITKLEVPND